MADQLSFPFEAASGVVLAFLRQHGPCSYTAIQTGCGLPGIVSSDAFDDLAGRELVRMLPSSDGEQQVWEAEAL
jgi:hypothetical protein